MGQDEIIWQNKVLEMAREAGFGEPINHNDWHLPFSAVKAFAKLVASAAIAKERERIYAEQLGKETIEAIRARGEA